MKVQSESGKLRKVLVSRPSIAHKRLTPNNYTQFLFDGIMWYKQALQQHEKMCQSLQKYGVEVYNVNELLEDVLAIDTVKHFLCQVLCESQQWDYIFQSEFSDYLVEQNSHALTQIILGGLTKSELPKEFNFLFSRLLSQYDFILHPLPNLLFQRDASFWIEDEANLASMQNNVRKIEPAILSAIYEFHPMFQNKELPSFTLNKRFNSLNSSTIEGGDVIYYGNGILLVGLSERSSLNTIDHLARYYFKHEKLNKILICSIPRTRAQMHLDTVFNFIDHDKVSYFPDIEIKPFLLEPKGGDSGAYSVHEPKEDFISFLKILLNKPKLMTIPTGGDFYIRQQEQWCDGNNFVCIKPGVLLSYDRNEFTNANLRKMGVTVVEFESSELSQGRGGPHCMTCPIERDAI